MPVDADSAVTDFDSAGVFNHFRKVLEIFRRGKNDLIRRHEKVGTDAVEEQRTDLPAETQRMCCRNELIVVVAVFIHEAKAAVFQIEIQIVDLLRHDTVGLRRTDRHDE